MKTKSIIAGLIVLVLIGATSVWPRKATAQNQRQLQAACAIMEFGREYDYSSTTNVFVDHAQLSSNLPQVPRGMNAAQAIAEMKNLGLKIDTISYFFVVMSTP